MLKHILIILLVSCTSRIALADNASQSAVFKVAIEDASPESKVLGVETCYGLIVAAQKIKNVEKPKNVKVEEILNAETLLLNNGRHINVRDVEFLYIRAEVPVAPMSEQGKHPNTDEGASGTH